MRFALVGNPNCGKTTLFNTLTKMTAKTGNWAGVTIEKKEGFVRSHSIVDLPGIYSLSSYSPEERLTKDFLFYESVDCIINIVDATNLERNLYLTLQLLELDIPIVIVLNMMDLVEKNHIKINKEILFEKLGVPIIEMSAVQNKKMEYLIKVVEEEAGKERKGKELIPTQFLSSEEIAVKRYQIVSDLLKNVMVRKEGKSITEKIDCIVTHRIWGIPIFICIMFFIFHCTFGNDFLYLHTLHIIPNNAFHSDIIGDSRIASPGMLLSNGVTYGVDCLKRGISVSLSSVPPWCNSFIVDGVISGVGTVLSFIPNILVLFFFLAILEDSGYMARVAFIMDGIFKHFGLSGKAILPLISCFGCAVPGIMATRTLKSEKERTISILLAPFFSCGAKLPIWTAFANHLFNGKYSEWIVFGMYGYGILVALIMAVVLNKILAGESEHLLLEMPSYHLPKWRNIFPYLWDKCKHYITKATTLIAVCTIIVWFLTHFNWHFESVNIQDSILGTITDGLAILFYPLGFGRGEYRGVFVLASFAGLIAKEEVPAVFSGLGILQSAIDSVSVASIFSFMSFNLLVIPCVAAVSTAKIEFGNRKMFWFSLVFWFVCAYFFSFIVYLCFTYSILWIGLGFFVLIGIRGKATTQ